MEHITRVITIENLTHDVKRFVCEKPPDYVFQPGQATEVSIHKKGWETEKRPFTFTSGTDAEELEFVIKIYPGHKGVTNELNNLVPGDELIVGDSWGAIEYKGPGYFIAGGAGITPFVAILRQLKKEGRLKGNMLFFSNKTEKDIILENEFREMPGLEVVHVISDQDQTKYHPGFINEQFLKDHVTDFSKHFYLCGPPAMVTALQDILARLGAAPDTVVFEK